MALIIKIILNTLMGPTRAIICPAHGRNTIAVNMYAPHNDTDNRIRCAPK